VGGNLNGHINMRANGYNPSHRCFDCEDKNSGRVSILDFRVTYVLVIVNLWFKKKENHLMTFEGGTTKTQIDYFLMRVQKRRLCKDCKVTPSEYLGTQHRSLVMDVEIKTSKGMKRSVGEPRIR